MSSLSTFGSFTTARLAIYASQKALDVVGNNIGNINTTGYTRQTLDQVSLYTGAADKYRNGLDARVGNGALVTGVSQMRDPYLDIRYRNETSTVGAMDAKLGGLEQLSIILDEVAKGEDEDHELGVVEKQFNDLIRQMQKLNTQGAELDTYDTNVRTSASSLTKQLNDYANRLDELHQTQERGLEDDLKKVNNILTGIRNLNESIRKSSIFGGDCLEQRDERNNLIDELSKYVRVDVTYDIEDLGGGLEIEKLVIKLNGNDTNPATSDPAKNNAVLIDGIYGSQLSIDKENNYNVTVGKLMDSHCRVQVLYEGNPPAAVPSTEIELTDNTLYGMLQSERELLTEQGEYATNAQLAVDPNANTKRGIPYYQKALDTLANQFANIMNETNRMNGAIDVSTITSATQVSADSVFKLTDGTYKRIATKTVVDPNTGDEIRMFNITDTTCSMRNDTAPVEPQRAAYADDAAYDAAMTQYKLEFTAWLNTPGVQDSIVAADGMMTAKQKEHLLPTKEGGLGHGNLNNVDAADVPETPGYILFSNSGNGNDVTGITAKNISISKNWGEGTVRINHSKELDAPSTDNTNLNTFLNVLQGKPVDFTPLGVDLTGTAHFEPGDTPASNEVFFTGTFQEMFTENICGTLATDRASTTDLLSNHMTSQDELYVDRDAVSGVDLNDEAMNMMQFQKSLNAAYRLMTVIDEALERLINNTGRAGL